MTRRNQAIGPRWSAIRGSGQRRRSRVVRRAGPVPGWGRSMREWSGEGRHPALASGAPAGAVVRAVERVVAQLADQLPRATVVPAEAGAAHAAEVTGDDQGMAMTVQEGGVLAQVGEVTDVAPGLPVVGGRDGVDPVS